MTFINVEKYNNSPVKNNTTIGGFVYLLRTVTDPWLRDAQLCLENNGESLL